MYTHLVHLYRVATLIVFVCVHPSTLGAIFNIVSNINLASIFLNWSIYTRHASANELISVKIQMARPNFMVKVHAIVLKDLNGFDQLDISPLHGKFLRQLCEGYVDDDGNDISGRFVLVDVIAAVLFNGNLISARQWLVNRKKVIIGVAISLAYVACGHSSVNFTQFK